MMRLRKNPIIIFFLIIFSVVCSVESTAGIQPQGYKQTSILDMVLIYQGGRQRSDWTPTEMMPYVVHKDRFGKKDWFFDGFLFLEFFDGANHNYSPGYSGKNSARKQEWEWLINRHFEDGKAIKALNTCVNEGIRELGKPSFKHRVVIGLPEPISNQKDWGNLNGKELDFSKREDRIAASKWFIDRLTERFEQSGLDHLELAGFYWVSEQMSMSEGITVDIGNYIREKGKQFYWIPYYAAEGYSQWKTYGFDVAYLQPNYFFSKTVPDDRVENACDLAYTYNMALEMEFDGRALAASKENFRNRLVNYIQTFQRKNVFKNSSIAYYEGGRGIYSLSVSSNRADREMIDTLAYFIEERRNRMPESLSYQEDFRKNKKPNEEMWTVSDNKKIKTTDTGLEISSRGDTVKLNAKNKIGMTYGRLDVRTRILSPEKGTKIRIHLMPAEEMPGQKPPVGELFLMSFDADDPSAIHVGANTAKMNEKKGNARKSVFYVDDLSKGFHTYTCEWEEKRVTFYIDGYKVNIQEDLYDKNYAAYPEYWPFNGKFYPEITVLSPTKKPAICIESIEINTNQINFLR